jgi:F-box interacting protein
MTGVTGPATVPEFADIALEILLKLPTKDVARCRCVSRLWRDVVADPSFNSLHAKAEIERNHVPPDSEVLIVTEIRERGRPDEASFLLVSSSRPMPYRVTIPSSYSLSNICNGLLCFAANQADAPAFVCNPVTGETSTFPKAPPPQLEHIMCHVFALGFSFSTKEHKLFRFSSGYSGISDKMSVDQSVHTLDGSRRGWRQHSYRTQCPLLQTVPPVLVDGKLYLVTTGSTGPEPAPPRNPDGLLEVDVATEAHRMFRLPFGNDEYHTAWDPLVNTFEMRGRLCLAVELLRGWETTVRKLQFWVLSSPPPDQ